MNEHTFVVPYSFWVLRYRLLGALDGSRPDEGLRREFFAWLGRMVV